MFILNKNVFINVCFLCCICVTETIAEPSPQLVEQERLDTALVVALHYSDQYGAIELLDAGANPNVADKSNKSALCIALVKKLEDAAILLIEKGADLNVCSWNGTPALWLSLRFGTPKVALSMIEHGADPNAVYMSDSILYTSILHQWPRVAISLLEAGANPNIGEDPLYMHSPLMIAGLFQQHEVIKKLIDCGANLNATTAQGLTLWDIVDEHTAKFIVRYRQKAATMPFLMALHGSGYQGPRSLTPDPSPPHTVESKDAVLYCKELVRYIAKYL